MMRLRHILLPTDLGESSTKAENFAVDLAKQVHAKVTLLHVWKMPAAAYAESLTWPTDAIEEAAARELDKRLVHLRTKLADIDSMLVSGVAPWERILDTAKQLDVDMIVVGTHGRHGLPRFVLGSVAEKIVRLSPVPVVTVADHAP